MCVCMCSVCAHACGCTVEGVQLGPCLSTGPTPIQASAHSFSFNFIHAHTHTPIYISCTHNSFWTSPGALPGPSSNIWEVGTHTHTHTHCFHLCLSSVCVSQCLGRKIGLCRAQRLESPKAARQIQLPQSLTPRFANYRSSHFKPTPLSQSHQPTLDGWLSLPPPLSL